MMWDLIMQSLGAACAAMSLAHHTFFWTSCESPLLLLTASHCSASAEQAKRDHTRSHNWLGDPIRISVSLPASNEFKKCLAIIVGRARWPNSSLRGTADCSEWVHSWTSTGRTRKSANMELGFGVFPNRWWGRVPLQRIFFQPCPLDVFKVTVEDQPLAVSLHSATCLCHEQLASLCSHAFHVTM